MVVIELHSIDDSVLVGEYIEKNSTPWQLIYYRKGVVVHKGFQTLLKNDILVWVYLPIEGNVGNNSAPVVIDSSSHHYRHRQITSRHTEVLLELIGDDLAGRMSYV